MLEALSNGAMDGVKLIVVISASLIGIIAFVALCNGILEGIGISLDVILSYMFYPLAFFMGFEHELTFSVAELFGEKLLLNEFIAFNDLMVFFSTLDYKVQAMLCVAIGGFANISSLAICLSTLGTLCPEKKSLVAKYVR